MPNGRYDFRMPFVQRAVKLIAHENESVPICLHSLMMLLKTVIK